MASNEYSKDLKSMPEQIRQLSINMKDVSEVLERLDKALSGKPKIGKQAKSDLSKELSELRKKCVNQAQREPSNASWNGLIQKIQKMSDKVEAIKPSKKATRDEKITKHPENKKYIKLPSRIHKFLTKQMKTKDSQKSQASTTGMEPEKQSFQTKKRYDINDWSKEEAALDKILAKKPKVAPEVAPKIKIPSPEPLSERAKMIRPPPPTYTPMAQNVISGKDRKGLEKQIASPEPIMQQAVKIEGFRQLLEVPTVDKVKSKSKTKKR